MTKKIFTIAAFLIFIHTAYSQALSSDTLHWVDYKTLSWTDFKGDTIDIPGYSGQSMMVMFANFRKASLFLPTKVNVVTVFDRKNSWAVKPARTDAFLKYYQVEFDIYEVYTRRLRKDFESTKFGLDPNKVFQEKYNAALTALSDRNKLYMKETKLGTDSDAVKSWETIIAKELAELKQFRQTK